MKYLILSPAVLLMILNLSGCQKSEKLYPVSGRIEIAGQPVAHAEVAFHPLKPDSGSNICPVGLTDEAGEFQLTTQFQHDGAAPGQYLVTLFQHDRDVEVDECAHTDPAEHDLLQGQFLDPKRSTIIVTVERHINKIVIKPTIKIPLAPRRPKITFEKVY